MADGHGGSRTPAKPAAVSGPGSLSKRTDGGGPKQVISVAPGQAYGDAKQQHADEALVPMGAATPLPNVPAQQLSNPGGGAPQQSPAYQGGDFGAPTNRPNEPVTHGSPIGPGGGPEALQLGPGNPGATPSSGQMTQLLASLMATDNTGVFAPLFQQAQAWGA